MDKEENQLQLLFEKLSETSPETFELKKIDSLLGELEKDFKLNDDEKQTIDGEVTLYIIKKPSPSLENLIESLKTQLLLTRDQTITESIIKKILFFLGEKKDASKNNELIPTQKSNESNFFESFKTQITKPKTIAPVERRVTDVIKTVKAESLADIKKDPYREIPEK